MRRTPFLLLALLSAVLLVSCGAAPTKASTTGTPAPTQPADQGYVFVVKGATIGMHAEVAPILEKLGTTKEYFEAPSCAFQGIERSYVYSGFKLTTYELDGVDHVASVLVLDDTVATPEGIFLNATPEQVTKAYGEPTEQKLGLSTYKTEKMSLSFLFEDGKLVSIEYAASANSA